MSEHICGLQGFGHPDDVCQACREREEKVVLEKGFADWAEDYGLKFEPNYSDLVENDCKAAYLQGVTDGWKAAIRWAISVKQEGKDKL